MPHEYRGKHNFGTIAKIPFWGSMKSAFSTLLKVRLTNYVNIDLTYIKVVLTYIFIIFFIMSTFGHIHTFVELGGGVDWRKLNAYNKFFGQVYRFRSYSFRHLDLVKWITHEKDANNVVIFEVVCPVFNGPHFGVLISAFGPRPLLPWWAIKMKGDGIDYFRGGLSSYVGSRCSSWFSWQTYWAKTKTNT